MSQRDYCTPAHCTCTPPHGSKAQRAAAARIRADVPHLWTGLGVQPDRTAVISVIQPNSTLAGWHISRRGQVTSL